MYILLENPDMRIDICNNNMPFGGKMIVLAGDFCQNLPVIHRANRSQIVRRVSKTSSLVDAIIFKRLFYYKCKSSPIDWRRVQHT